MEDIHKALNMPGRRL